MSTPSISVQLYSIHEALDADPDGSLGRLADIGFRTVEAFDFVRRADALKESFQRHGLSAPTAHAFLIEEEGIPTPDGLWAVPPAEEVFAAATTLGADVVIDPFVPPNHWQNLTDVQRNADRLNARAVQAAKHGLRVGYHNHDHELALQLDGRPAFDVFVELLDPSVLLEIDLYWAAAAGADLVALVKQHSDRLHAVHVKDGPLRPGISARQLPTDQLPAGQGDVPLSAALAAAHDLAYAVVEFDHYEGDIFDGIRQSYQFLTRQHAAS
ncbi:sugar phosphate isomerase/epimerase family protein [Angustibacter sp. McL0619]|uniref:sugar phosphate isomerase/epimerase family protein n=1 Tax=Angustibacter sp. McL0619 TaxID=3415676 RepID=UPI003CFA5748